MSFYRFFQAGPKKRAVLPTAAPYGFVLAGMASETQVHLDGHIWGVRPCAWRRGIALRPFECYENDMFRSLRSLASVTFTAILMIGMAPVFAQTAKDDVKGAKEDIKDAGAFRPRCH